MQSVIMVNGHALTQVAKKYLSQLRRVVKSARSFSKSANVHANIIRYLHLSVQREMSPIKSLPMKHMHNFAGPCPGC